MIRISDLSSRLVLVQFEAGGGVHPRRGQLRVGLGQPRRRLRPGRPRGRRSRHAQLQARNSR